MRVLLLLMLMLAAGVAPAANFTLEQVGAGPDPITLAPLKAGQLDARLMPIPVEHGVVRARPIDGQIWLKLEPKRGIDQRQVLAIGRSVESIDVYAPPDYRVQRIGRQHMGQQLQFSERAAVVLLEPEQLRAPTYLSIERRSLTPFTIELKDEPIYRQLDLNHVRFTSMIYAIMLGTALTALCFGLILGEKLFLLYVLQIALLLLFQGFNMGWIFRLPGGDALSAHAPLWRGLVLLACVIVINLFARAFVDAPRYAPFWDRVLRWIIVVQILSVALVVLPPNPTTAMSIVAINLSLIISSFGLLAMGIQAAQRGSRAARFFLLGWVPLLFGTALYAWQASGGVATWRFVAPLYEAAMAFESVLLSLGLADRALQARRERDRMQFLADCDGLTGLLNRRAVSLKLEEAFDDARRGKHALALLFIDLDHFKQINDTLGHAVGDVCLRATAELLRRELGPQAIVGRWGGEEFVALLADSATESAQQTAERVREAIQREGASDARGHYRFTASIGLATFAPTFKTIDQLIEASDIAMYRAKAHGRNRVEFADLSAIQRTVS
jgi:diguanylate cyclase (GGDEF)-like protein